MTYEVCVATPFGPHVVGVYPDAPTAHHAKADQQAHQQARMFVRHTIKETDMTDTDTTTFTGTRTGAIGRYIERRLEAFNAVLDRYDIVESPAENDIESQFDMARPFVLVERNTRESRHWVTCHPSAQAAVDAHFLQEYAGDWLIEEITDLRNNQTWTATHVAIPES